ncbi:MAG: ABC transporter ATP-binding protein [Acidobacteria bacterium]|nr:ABC transporter ATP-binding protein [Acidobacteriota bacterium]
MSSDFILEFHDVYKSYDDLSGTKLVLNDIDLQVRKGEFITLLGPSGCGKSTMLRLILGSEKPSKGTVMIDGLPAEGPSRDRGIVYQKYSLFPHLTVLDNVIFGLDLEQFSQFSRYLQPAKYRRERKKHQERGAAMLERMGLGHALYKYPHQLSGGMRQRVAIAQAMIMEPKILLMDEPFGALDDNSRTDMQLFILEQWERTHMTVFFVTHDLVEALFLGSRLLVLSQYYTTAKDHNEGSKIVTDREVPGGFPKPTSFKNSPHLKELLNEVRRSGLDPEFARHITEFDLSHRDAMRTVTPEEWGNGQKEQ